jgi:hypothetical protein
MAFLLGSLSTSGQETATKIKKVPVGPYLTWLREGNV